jgi:hypothetical protein
MTKAILLSLFASLLLVASVASFQLPMSRSPFITCETDHCLDSLDKAINAKCKGDLCIDIVKQHSDVCKTCAIEISEGKHYSMIAFSNNEKLKSIVCDQDEKLHVAICRFHCALDYKKNHQCAKQTIQVNTTIVAESKTSICTCS